MPDTESVFDRAHRLEYERTRALRAPDDVPAHLARLEALLCTVLAEVQALRAAVTAPPSDTSR